VSQPVQRCAVEWLHAGHASDWSESIQLERYVSPEYIDESVSMVPAPFADIFIFKIGIHSTRLAVKLQEHSFRLRDVTIF